MLRYVMLAGFYDVDCHDSPVWCFDFVRSSCWSCYKVCLTVPES